MSSWEVRWSNSRQLPYFYDNAAGTSTWEQPPGLSNEDLKRLPGAHYLTGGSGAAGNASAAETNGKVRASHLLVKHAQSRRPSSWKEVSSSGAGQKRACRSMPHHSGRSLISPSRSSSPTSLALPKRQSRSFEVISPLWAPTLPLSSSPSSHRYTRKCASDVLYELHSRSRLRQLISYLLLTHTIAATAHQLKKAETWASSLEVRCRSHSRMPPLPWASVHSAASFRRTVVHTLSFVPLDAVRE